VTRILCMGTVLLAALQGSTTRGNMLPLAFLQAELRACRFRTLTHR
jgi:hypothetical protein